MNRKKKIGLMVILGMGILYAFFLLFLKKVMLMKPAHAQYQSTKRPV
jgi:hypothetical protein